MTVLQCIGCIENYVGMLTFLVELIGAILVVITLHKDKKRKQAEFITEYNFHFISSDPLIEMERKLENCYQICKMPMREIKNDSGNIQIWEYQTLLKAMEEEMKLLPIGPLTLVTKNYQRLINYLVYLESFAPLVLTKQIELKKIDDTFGYRYFVAMNNPVVQKFELLAEGEYYRGCIRLYEKWFKYRKSKGKGIPMEWFALSHTGEKKAKGLMNPVYQAEGGQELLEEYKRITKKRCLISQTKR